MASCFKVPVHHGRKACWQECEQLITLPPSGEFRCSTQFLLFIQSWTLPMFDVCLSSPVSITQLSVYWVTIDPIKLTVIVNCHTFQ